MTAKETIEEKLEELARVIAPDDGLTEHVMRRIDATPTFDCQALTGRDIWRTIMKSRITRFAAAAVIVIVIVLSILFLDKSVAPAYAVTDLPGLFEQATTIHIQGWKYFPGHRMPNGEQIQPVEIDNWIDLENSRSRYTGTGIGVGKSSVKVTISETISDGQYKLILNHVEKNAVFFSISDYQRMLEAYRNSGLIYGQIFGDIEQLRSFEQVGWEQVDGVEYQILQRETAHAVSEHTLRLKFWLSPQTGKLGRVQMWRKVADGQWGLNYDYLHIDYDVVIPDGIFAMEPPEGYALKNTLETAIPQELSIGGSVGYANDNYNLQAAGKIGFLISNGSVILAWHSSDSKSNNPQSELFMGLEFGGPLPLLPVEIYGLKPSGVSSDVTYTGYHLAHSQKAGRFFEWSLYVPNGVAPASVRQLGCDVLYRFNLEAEPKWRIGLTVDCSTLIKDAADFDKWVLGAMAELSDDGTTPAGITYERVLTLAEQVGESLAK